jgi:hypothetical protein
MRTTVSCSTAREARSAATLIALASLSIAAAGAAATAPPDPRLSARLDSVTAGQVWAAAESARAAGLPVEPLVSRALEGAARRASAPRIVAAVRRQAAALAAARSALGPRSQEAEIVAGAAVLLAGVPQDTLARLRAAQPRISLVVPLVVLADLLARQVPQATAATAVVAVTAAGVRDADLFQLRQRIERDIAAGADPATAARVRTNGLLMLHGGSTISSTTGPPRGARPPPRGPGP